MIFECQIITLFKDVIHVSTFILRIRLSNAFRFYCLVRSVQRVCLVFLLFFFALHPSGGQRWCRWLGHKLMSALKSLELHTITLPHSSSFWYNLSCPLIMCENTASLFTVLNVHHKRPCLLCVTQNWVLHTILKIVEKAASHQLHRALLVREETAPRS